jgi:hypothetical protein
MKFVDKCTRLRIPLVMATGFPAGLTGTSDGLEWPAAAFLQHGASAENTVITERKCGPRRRGLHHVAVEAIHQTRRIEIQQQTDVDAAHGDAPRSPTRSPDR